MSPTLQLLGAIALRRHDGTVVTAGAMSSVKALDLVLLLAAAGSRWHSADHYVHLLWPSADDERGKASLRTAVAQVRRALGRDVVVRSGELLGLGEADTDVARLRLVAAQVEEARRAGSDHQVVRLVEQLEEWCDDLVVSGSSCPAVYAARDELRELRRRALLDAAAAAGRLGRMRASLDFALLAHGLTAAEESTRALMVAWAGLGEAQRAIEVFEQLRTQLDETYGVQPSPETRAVYLSVVTAGEEHRLEPAELHGHVTADLARAIVALADLPRPGGVVWVHGEPGSGRGTVLRQARRLVRDVAPDATVDFRPEIVRLDDLEAERLRREAVAGGRVVVVPVRGEVRPTASGREAQVRVGVLTGPQFRELLRQLLQERPGPELEARLWTTTRGLAGHTCRTVRHLVDDGALVWRPGRVDLADLPSSSALVAARAG